MSAAQAIVDLQGDTESFLRANILVIAGGASAAAAGPATFWMDVRGHGGFNATKLSDAAAAGRANLFPAFYVPMQQLGAVGAPTFAVNFLPAGGDLRLMVTSQITGCLFGMARTPGGLGVAHIQPDANAYRDVAEAQRSALKQSDLRMSARVQGLQTIAAQGQDYDRNKGDAVTIVGVRGLNGQWDIFRQKWNSLTNAVLEVTSL